MSEPSEYRYTSRTLNTLLASFLLNGEFCGWSSNISAMALSMMSAHCAVFACWKLSRWSFRMFAYWWVMVKLTTYKLWELSMAERPESDHCAVWWYESECYADVRTALVIIYTFTRPAKTGLKPQCSYHCMYHWCVSSHTCNAYATCFIMVMCMNCAACYVRQMNFRQFTTLLCQIAHWKTN